MKPEERKELEQAAGRIAKTSRRRTAVLAVTVALVVIVVNVAATAVTLSRASRNRQQVAEQLAITTERNAAISVAAEVGLRCILSQPSIPPKGPERLAVFDDCYRQFDRLVETAEEERREN